VTKEREREREREKGIALREKERERGHFFVHRHLFCFFFQTSIGRNQTNMRKRPSSPGRGLPIAAVGGGGYAQMRGSSNDASSSKQQSRSKVGRMLLLLNVAALLVFWIRSSSAATSASASSASGPRPLVLHGDGSVSAGDKSSLQGGELSSSASSLWSSGSSALGRRLGLGGGGGSGHGSNHLMSSLSSSSSTSSSPSSPSLFSEEDRDRVSLDAAAARLGLALESPVVQAALAEAERLGHGGGGKHLERQSLNSKNFKSLDLDAEVEQRALQLKAAPLELARGHDASRQRRGYYLSYVETDPLYPFQRIRFGNGSDSGVVAVIAPFYDLNYFRSETQRALFWRLKASGHIVLGVSSYQEFPGNISNPHDDRHVTSGDLALLSHVDGWLHCFRPQRAARVLPAGVPRLLLSESDFTDPERRDGGGSLVPWGAPEVNKTWDLVYSDQGKRRRRRESFFLLLFLEGESRVFFFLSFFLEVFAPLLKKNFLSPPPNQPTGGDWNDYARNWPLAIDCIVKLAEERNASTLVMG